SVFWQAHKAIENLNKAQERNDLIPDVGKKAEREKERAKEPWEISDLAAKPNIGIDSIRALEQPDGKFKLFYRGTRNEVFPGNTFNSATEAKKFFSVQKGKALESKPKESIIKPLKEKTPIERAEVITPVKTEEVIKGTNPEVRELVLHEMWSGLETGTPGGLQGQDESGNPIYAKSGYPEWFSDIVKKYGNKKTSPTGEKESINAKYLANIITKGLKSDKLTSKQSIIWEDVNKIADHESGKTYAGIVNQFEKVRELQNETREQLAKEEIDAGEIAESKDDLVSGTSEILETEGYSPEQLEAAHTEIASFFDEMSKESYITKQPWEQTREEFVGDATGDEKAIRLAAHAQHVKQAVANGEKVSLEVLNHYKNNVWAQIAIDKIKSKGDVQTELEGTDSFNLANQAAPRGMGEKIKEVIPTGNLFTKEEKNIIPYSKDLKITNLDILPKGIGARYLLTVKGNNEDYIAKAWKKAVPVTMGKSEVLIDLKPETKTEVQTAKDINQEIVTSLQEISDKITDIYKVPKISIQITTAKGKGAASYNTWRVKGGKINNARDITIYNYDNIKNSKGEIIHKLSHELAHHISNSLYGSLKHDNRQGGLEDDIGSYISTKLREMIKTEKEILESKTKDVSFQRKTKDARYLELAKDPEKNRDELQAMVDDAAYAAGCVVEENSGDLVPMYHGSVNGTFNTFDSSRSGLNTGSSDANLGFFFTESKNIAIEFFGKGKKENVRKFYLVAEKPMEMEVYEYEEALFGTEEEQSEDGYDYREYKESDTVKEKFDEIKQTALDEGYDSIHLLQPSFKPDNPEFESPVWIVFSPSQIKSADPVTYDNNGNVIPLSERFNPDKEDFRFARGVSTGLRGFFSQLEKVVTEKLTEMPSKVQSIPKWLERQNVKP
ncbi:MAG: hypothetical protein M0R00_09435, partial [Candidatus Omnitrophica bacterium]|nr:hypothetical protein [Candidatus Omnitrophota bacterium]